MNKIRRAAISAQLQIISGACEKLEDIKEEEQDYYDNMPESLQQSEKGDAAMEAIDQLDLAIDGCNTATSALENIE